MIIGTMTPAEVAHDARQDIRAINNKVKDIAARLERQARTAHGRFDRVDHLIPWRSPRRNNWLLLLHSSKKGSTISSLVWYRGEDQRIRAMRVDLIGNATHLYFSAHVLERYGQRFDPLRDPVERLRNFFLHNHSVAIHSVKDHGNGEHTVLGGLCHGLLTGHGNTAQRMVEFTTFLDMGLLYPEQQELVELLDLQRELQQFTPGQRAEFVRRVQRAEERSGKAA